MPRGLWRLTWLEIKIFLREPLSPLQTFCSSLRSQVNQTPSLQRDSFKKSSKKSQL